MNNYTFYHLLLYSIKNNIFDEFLISKKIHEELQNLDLKLTNWNDFFDDLLTMSQPSKFFNFLKSFDLLKYHFKEIEDLIVPDKHDGTAYQHTMNLLDNVNINSTTVLTYERVLLLKYGLLFHDFGKGLTDKTKHPSHFGHAELGVVPISNFCNRFNLLNEYEHFGLLCSTLHMKFKVMDQMKKGKLFKLIICCSKTLINNVYLVSYYDSIIRSEISKQNIYKYFVWVRHIMDTVIKIDEEENLSYYVNNNSNLKDNLNKKIHKFIKQIAKIKQPEY